VGGKAAGDIHLHFHDIPIHSQDGSGYDFCQQGSIFSKKGVDAFSGALRITTGRRDVNFLETFDWA
jgi:diadenosine tetraphosphate (Ap4A) HIT family hydrolase